MNTLVTATQHLSQPCGPLPVKDCHVRHAENENGKKRHFRRSWYPAGSNSHIVSHSPQNPSSSQAALPARIAWLYGSEARVLALLWCV